MSDDVLKLLAGQSLKSEEIAHVLERLPALPVRHDGLQGRMVHTGNRSKRLLRGGIDVDEVGMVGLVIHRKLIGDLLEDGLGKALHGEQVGKRFKCRC